MDLPICPNSEHREFFGCGCANAADNHHQLRRVGAAWHRRSRRDAKRRHIGEIGTGDLASPNRRIRSSITQLHPCAGIWRAQEAPQKSLQQRRLATDVNVELVLTSRRSRVDRKRDFVGRTLAAIPCWQEGASVPRGGEIIGRVGGLQPRIFDADDLARRREQEIRRSERRPQNHKTPRFVSGDLNLETRKRSSSQLKIGDAGAHDLPKRVAPRRNFGRRRGDGENRRERHQIRGLVETIRSAAALIAIIDF
jgi:hypothetical protein